VQQIIDNFSYDTLIDLFQIFFRLPGCIRSIFMQRAVNHP
jgi:hypothetical protein